MWPFTKKIIKNKTVEKKHTKESYDIYEIAENNYGEFQVWKLGICNKKVLAPDNLSWYADYQAHHDFMFFSSKYEAEKAVEGILDKELGRQTKAVHKIS